MKLMNLNVNLESLRYKEDLHDYNDLLHKYNVEGFIQARHEDDKQTNSLRDKLMSDGVFLTKTISPRIYKIIEIVTERLLIKEKFDVFCLKDSDINAFASIDINHNRKDNIIALTSGALEQLNDNEIAFLIGHELGHFIFRHNDMLALLVRDKNNPNITVLPYMGECLFLRWRKKSEISADRIGLIASHSFEASSSALIKAGFGLTEKNLNLDIDSLLKQIESIKESPEAIESNFRSHPLLPLRLKSLELMWKSIENNNMIFGPND